MDSLALAKVIQKEAIKNNRHINILLQIKIAEEETKSGYNYNQLLSDIQELKSLDKLNINGVMGIGTFTSDVATTQKEFNNLKQYFNQLKSDHFTESSHFSEISMGMSGDYELAIEHGSTMVRIGSLLFGTRL